MNVVLDAYWISPRGEVLPVRGNHIDELRKAPGKFGLTNTEIASDDSLLYGSLQNGWLRIRFYKDYDSTYFIDVWDLGDSEREYLWLWASAIVEEDRGKESASVVIREKRSGATLEYSLRDISFRALFSGRSVFPFGKLVWVTSVRDISGR